MAVPGDEPPVAACGEEAGVVFNFEGFSGGVAGGDGGPFFAVLVDVAVFVDEGDADDGLGGVVADRDGGGELQLFSLKMNRTTISEQSLFHRMCVFVRIPSEL